MDYKITSVTDELVFIKWYKSPEDTAVEQAFVDDIQKLLNAAPAKIYFLSDLRQGRITNIAVLRKLGGMAKHPNWGGGTAFTNNPLSTVFAEIFLRFVKKSNRPDGIWYSYQEALAFLEQVKPGITQNINWLEIFDGK